MNAQKYIRLGEVLRLEIDAVPVDPTVEYNFAGVYSFGRGLFARGPLSGGNTSYKYFHRLHAGDFVISEPKAWEGAIARIPVEFDGFFLSPVFPSFRLIGEDISAEYLELFLKQPRVWNELRTGAKGLGARRETVTPSLFLDLRIPAPLLQEQNRVVDLLRKMEDVLKTNDEVGRELKALLNSSLVNAFDGKL